MIDLTSKGLPNTITVQGRPYSIYTDFRIWIRVTTEIQNLGPGAKIDLGYIFKNDRPAAIDMEKELLPFLAPKSELPRTTRHSSAIPLDYELDADLIYAAFLGQYGIDLTEADLHWWKFQALLKGLNDSTRLKEIMGYRCYEKRTDKTDPYEELKQAWEITRTNKEDQEALDAFNAAFTVPEE